eukprot:COSAG04_NODE_9464_length_862_cov_0.926606_3_plen_53_part_01
MHRACASLGFVQACAQASEGTTLRKGLWLVRAPVGLSMPSSGSDSSHSQTLTL